MNTNFSISIPIELTAKITEICEERGISRSKYIKDVLETDLASKIQELISDVKKYITMFEEDNIPTMPLINIIDTLEDMLNL